MRPLGSMSRLHVRILGAVDWLCRCGESSLAESDVGTAPEQTPAIHMFSRLGASP
jgi:hypothetical protein